MSKTKINRIIPNEYNSKLLKIKEYLCSNFKPWEEVNFYALLKIFSNEKDEEYIRENINNAIINKHKNPIFMQKLNEIYYYIKYLYEQEYVIEFNDWSNSFSGFASSFKVSLKLFLERKLNNKIFFAREFNNKKTFLFFRELKKKIEEDLKLEVVMLEDDPISGNINNRIFEEINNCTYFIADLTYKSDGINRNVIYEIGLAQGMNKKTLLIMNENCFPFKNDNDQIPMLPFDISSHTTIKYSYNQEECIKSILDCISIDIENNKNTI